MSKELHIAVLLFPGFQLLDAAGPLDAFNVLTSKRPGSLRLSILSTTLEPVPTRPGSTFTQSISPTHTFSSPPTAPIDALFIPGGFGARPPADHSQLIAFIQERASAASYIMTVCTGTLILAQTGLLDSGVKATTNKAAFKDVVKYSEGAQWIYEARWVVDGKFWTSSGVSAGIDMALAWIGHREGRDLAVEIARHMEYTWQEDSTRDEFAQFHQRAL